MRYGVFRKPILKFKNGTTLSPLDGMLRGYLPLRGLKKRIKLVVIVPSILESEFHSFWTNYWLGTKNFIGLKRFMEDAIIDVSIVKINPYHIYNSINEYKTELENADAAILIVPKKKDYLWMIYWIL